MKSAPRPVMPTEMEAPSTGNSTVVPNPKKKGTSTGPTTSRMPTAAPKTTAAKKKKPAKAKKKS